LISNDLPELGHTQRRPDSPLLSPGWKHRLL